VLWDQKCAMILLTSHVDKTSSYSNALQRYGFCEVWDTFSMDARMICNVVILTFSNTLPFIETVL
jgi:hypothetical protein